MGITVTKMNFTRTLYRLVLLSGLQDPDFNTPHVKEDAPFTLSDFKEALHQSSIEIQLLIADTLEHPFRANYFTETPITLTTGDKIPSALAAHSKVEVWSGKDNETFIVGRLARNRRHIEVTNSMPSLYGEGGGLYFIENSHIYFVGVEAMVYSPTIELNRTAIETADTLNLPDVYSNHVIANAMKMLYMNGQDMAQRSFYITQAEQIFLPRIIKNDLDTPKPERFQQFNN